MRAIGMDPVHDTRACFRALVDAQSRPGTVQATDRARADHAVIATLVDHEVSLATTDSAIASALASEGRLTEAAPEDADIVHATEPTDGAVREYDRGTLEEPSDGATVVYRVDGLHEDTDAAPDDWTTLSLEGPGVPGQRSIAVEGLPAAEARALADAQSTYPRGVDAVLTTENRIAAVPRSITLEVA